MAGAITHKEVVIPPPGPLIDGADWLAEHQLNPPEIGAVLVGDPSQSDKANWVATGIAGQVLLSGGPGVLPSWQTIVLVGHDILSPSHADAITATVVQGDLLVGNATPKWDRLPIGVAGAVLVSDGNSPVWSLTPTLGSITVAEITVSALTAGRVAFAGAAGILDDDAAFAWDDTGKNLRIGGVTPGTSLANGIAWGIGVAPTAAHPADAAQFWVGDNIAAIAGTAGLWIRNEAGGRVYIGDSGFAESQIRIFDSTLAKSVKLVVSASSAIFGSDEDIPFVFGTNGTERIQMLSNGNIVIGVDATVGASAQVALYVNSGVAPTTSPADKAAMWVDDIAGAGTAGWGFRGETGHVHRLGRLLRLAGGTSGSFIMAGGTVASSTASTGTPATTAETILLTFTLPANMVPTNGDKVNFHFSGTLAANANNKTVRLRIGGLGGPLVVDSGLVATNNADWILYGTAYRIGPTSMRIDAMLLVGPAGAASGAVSAHRMNRDVVTTDFTANVTFDLTGQNGTASANDIQVTGGSLELWPV